MQRYKKLVLLHSNDMHGDFLDEKIDDELVGGVSLLSGYVNKVREEEENVIYCIAGDMFRGSVIDSEFQGVSTIEIMNMLSPDVVTIGNHETDYGVAHLLFIEKCAKFPIINANLHITTNNARLFNPCHIEKIGGMKILFIGIITQEVISQTKTDGIIGSFIDINEAASEVGKICDAYNALDIDLTGLLTHIGFEEDKKLAQVLDPAWGVDVIVGGHSHTFIEEPANVNGITIVQAGTGTDQIGRFDIIVDTDNNCVDSYTWQAVSINDTTCPRDTKIENIVMHYKSHTDEKYGRMVTHFKKKLTHPCRTQETALGNLFADILRESLELDIMLLGSGSIRNEELGPIVLFQDLAECFPYDDAVYVVKATGEQLKHMIKFMLRDETWEGDHCEFYQFSKGMKVVYNKANHEFKEFSLNGKEVCDDKLYRIGLQYFHFNSVGDFFDMPLSELEKNAKARIVATSCRDVLDEYLSSHNNLTSDIYGRLTVE